MTRCSKTYYKIEEVAEMFNILSSTLRWWEREISELNPLRTKGGQRRYQAEDLEVVRKIITLTQDRGLSLDAVGKFLRTSAAPKRRPLCKSDEDGLKILAQLRSHVHGDAKALLLIEAVEKYLNKS